MKYIIGWETDPFDYYPHRLYGLEGHQKVFLAAINNYDNVQQKKQDYESFFLSQGYEPLPNKLKLLL